MTAYKLGHKLLRCTALQCGDGLLWSGCRFQDLGSDFFAHVGQRHAGLSCFSNAVQKGRSSGGYSGSAVRFYSQEGTGWQALNASAGRSHGSRNHGDATDLPSSPEGNVAAVPLESAEKTAPFYVRLQECHSPADVLDLTERLPLTSVSVSSSLSRIWETAKKMSEEQRRYELKLIFDHPVFKRLCASAMQNAPTMRSDDLAFSLLAAVKLGVPQRTRLVQTLLRATQERLQEFDGKALSVMASVLWDMESDKNVEALRKGLSMVVEDRVSGIEGVMTLQTLMRSVGRDAPLALKRKLEKKALSMAPQFSLPNAQHMVSALAAMGFHSKPLLAICSKKIAENIHIMPTPRLVFMLKACKDLSYRDVHLLSAVAEHLTSTFEMWNNKQTILFLLRFTELRFRPVELLDGLLERVMDDPASLTQKDVLSVLKVCSLLNHVPENCEQEFLEKMTSIFESYLHKMTPTDLLRGVYFLCMLGHFPLAPFEKLLRRETLDELTQDGQPLQTNQRKLHFVDLCLRLDRPAFPRALSVPPGTIDPPLVSQTVKTVSQDWGKLLQKIVGDGALQEGVVLEKTYFVDCLITLPQERAELGSASEGEQLSPEPGRRVAVLFAPPSFFCLGTSHPLGRLVVMMRHLKALGCTPVLVPEHEFDLLSEEEQVAELTNLIFPLKEEAAV